MKRRAFLGALAALPVLAGTRAVLRRRPVPTPSQLLWQQDELAMFIHFGINTFTGREWGDGTEDARLFEPTRLDAREWARTARAAGFRALVLTAKHHDGFCLWPTATTSHSVASSPFRSGQGDVVREFVDGCRAEGMRVGLYCSPWDRNAPSYGTARYNDLYADQLTELLTRYGPVHEVWFDGANGEGPNGRRQEYDWPRTFGLVRRLQPDAVIFSDAGPDVRWIGNESGEAGDPNWSMVDPSVVPVPGTGGDPTMLNHLQHGDRHGSVWRPGESDVSIRPGWFHHPEEDDRVRDAEDLVRLYFASVGRNSKLLLNVPPMKEGRLHDADAAQLEAMRRRLDDLFDENLAADARQTEQGIELVREASVTVADLREDVRHGQVVARYVLEGDDGSGWRTLSRGTTIGHRKLDRFEPVRVRRVRLRIEEADGIPEGLEVRLYSD